jgi:ribonuclease D
LLKLLLKNLRSERAKEKGVSTLEVLNNKEIEEIIKLKPKRRTDLLLSTSIRDKVIEELGDRIIKLVN